MPCNPCESDFHFLGVVDVKVFPSCHFFRLKVTDVVFDFVDQILGRLGVVSVQGFYRCLVIDAEVDAGTCAVDRSSEVEA